MSDDWTHAEALALEYLKTEKQAVDPIELFRFEAIPFIFGARWPTGDGRVVIYDGKVQTARGLAALGPYLSWLGESRVRALSVGLFEGLLSVFDVPQYSCWSRGAAHYHDLFPAIVESNGVLKYVVNNFDAGHGYPGRGSRPPGAPIVFRRYSLQIWPVVSELAWQFEEQFERPVPPMVIPTV